MSQIVSNETLGGFASSVTPRKIEVRFDLHLELNYRTQWGESVCVELILQKNVGQSLRQMVMHTMDGYCWTLDIPVSERDVTGFTYEYIIMQNSQAVRREWNIVPRQFTARSGASYIMKDFWRDIPEDVHLYSTAYTNVVSHFEPARPQLVYYDKTLVFRVQAPQLKAGQALALVGSQPPLGAWSQDRLLPMHRAGVNEWVLTADAAGLYLPFEYKYVIIDEARGTLIRWEDGPNRCSPSQVMDSRTVLVMFDTVLRTKAERWKAAGVVVPLFSLRSRQSQGVGDFGDLEMMADWAADTGMHVIQLLPISDTTQNYTWTDSYPYNAISIYALHPMYADLRQLPSIQDAAWLRDYEIERQRLNELDKVDYEKVNALKQDYLRRLYQQEGRQTIASPEFQSFLARNEEWLEPYTVFCMLRDKYGSADTQTWPRYKVCKTDEIHALAKRRAKECGYYAFVQFILSCQLQKAVNHAHQRGVMLKGDIPIGISRHSVEAWVEPHYFRMNTQAGAPPDAFSRDGQNWGFPTYDWQRMAQDGYQWWVKRLGKMAEYFDAYRIDHVLGFFRIWQIPYHSVHGLLGHFSPSLPMSVEEIERYGISFSRQRLTQPYITDAILEKLFADKAATVRRDYLLPAEGGLWKMKPEYATQRQVEKAFQGKDDDSSTLVRDGLYRLISNVLFVPDEDIPETFHPRIAAMDDFVFQSLLPHEKDAFCRLHDDYYYQRHNSFWEVEAMKKLPPLVQSTRMLVCAEDLGMVPSCVEPVMERLRMLSLEIQTMPKAFGIQFGRLEDNPYRSVATIFTHDMPTLRGWWEEDFDRTQIFFNKMLQHDGAAPKVMPGWLCEEVVARHLYSPSMLCLISLQDWLSMDEALRRKNPDEERINVPANSRHYWRYRMHLDIEDLMEAVELNNRIRHLIRRGGRDCPSAFGQ